MGMERNMRQGAHRSGRALGKSVPTEPPRWQSKVKQKAVLGTAPWDTPEALWPEQSIRDALEAKVASRMEAARKVPGVVLL